MFKLYRKTTGEYCTVFDVMERSAEVYFLVFDEKKLRWMYVSGNEFTEYAEQAWV